jgi:hypothetical protein
MTGPELEEAVAWVEVSLKGRMVKKKRRCTSVDAGEGLLKKSPSGGNDNGPNQNLIAKVGGGGVTNRSSHTMVLLCFRIRNEVAERGE